jgi:hypothetical protein
MTSARRDELSPVQFEGTLGAQLPAFLAGPQFSVAPSDTTWGSDARCAHLLADSGSLVLAPMLLPLHTDGRFIKDSTYP